MALFRAFATTGFFTLLSRIAGFVRDVLTARFVGVSPVADAFFIALRFPNFFRRLFAEGAFNVSFVPMFSNILEAEGLDEAKKFAEEAMSVLVSFLVPFTLVIVFSMPWVMHFLANGFVGDPVRFPLAVELTCITFPYLIMVSVVALLGGVLNSLHRFGAFAAAPIAFNFCMAMSLIIALPYAKAHGDIDIYGHAMAYGVVTSGIIQVLWLFWSAKRAGLNFTFRRPRLTPKVRRLLILMTPGMIAGGVTQINLLVDISLATFLEKGSVSYLYYADRLNQLPLGILGIAIGAALLPMLARALKSGDGNKAQHLLSRSLELSLLLAFPAAVALVVASKPIMIVLFQRGEFSMDAAVRSAYALSAFAAGLPAYIIIKVMSTAFFAREDTVTPVRISIIMTIVNASVAMLLISPYILCAKYPSLGTCKMFILPMHYAHVWIPIVTACDSWTQVYIMRRILKKRGHFDLDQQFMRRWPKLVLAALGMGVCIFVASYFLDPVFMQVAPDGISHELHRLIALGGIVTLGVVVYFALCFLMKAINLDEIMAMVKKTEPALIDTGDE